MNQAELEPCLIKGARTAVRRAFRWSGDQLWPGDTGAENLLQVSVAEALYRFPGIKPAIHLEPTLNRIDEEAFEGDTRRVDIGLLWRGTAGRAERYFSVVEIKKHPGRYDEDLDKICAVLDRVPSVRYAYLVTYFQKFDPHRNLKKSLNDQIRATAAAIKAEAQRSHARPCTSLDPETLHSFDHADGRWRAAVLLTRFSRD